LGKGRGVLAQAPRRVRRRGVGRGVRRLPPAGQSLRVGEVGRGLGGRAELPEGEAELVVDLRDLVLASAVLFGGLQPAPERRRRIGGTVEGQQAAAEVEQVQWAGPGSYGPLESGQR